MFEAYTEKARRVIFFARYEASQFGCEYIEADFLLLGIAREHPSLCVRWLGANYFELRESISRMYSRGKEIPTSVDLPLSEDSKRVLAYAAEEAERLGQHNIGTEHLFLGLLREPDCTAARVLKTQGQGLKSVRLAIAKGPESSEEEPHFASPTSAVTMKLVNENGDELAVLPHHGRVPNIGEAFSLPDPVDFVATYRVLDVSWQVKPGATSTLRIAEVVLKVRKEKL